MENYLVISHLNDFIFCPRSIYFHKLYERFDDRFYKREPQVAGLASHETIDNKTYSSHKNVLQGTEVFSSRYNLVGKIDLFYKDEGHLVERKRRIVKIYDGYIFQLYGQYFGLLDEGFEIKKITIRDLTSNRNYPIPLPTENSDWLDKFEKLIIEISQFSLNSPFHANPQKCVQCIYSPLCDQSAC
jgi:CRISPR-associated exonuclease Cas4